MNDYPVLYSFRRCPYAMRARLALAAAGVTVGLREVALKDKPVALRSISAKATVPVLQLPDQRVIDESLDIVFWALGQNDANGWLDYSAPQRHAMAALVEVNDGDFKFHLDRYKYADRFAGDHAGEALAGCERFLAELESRLAHNEYLFGARVSYADMVILPFVRQFAQCDRLVFDGLPYPRLRQWLDGLLQGDLFLSVMTKYKAWQPQDLELLWPVSDMG
ncbi:MAG: glutathione S-transferase [Cyclobacteriaceae bacterium]|jgi:glutathione S-transferase